MSFIVEPRIQVILKMSWRSRGNLTIRAPRASHTPQHAKLQIFRSRTLRVDSIKANRCRVEQNVSRILWGAATCRVFESSCSSHGKATDGRGRLVQPFTRYIVKLYEVFQTGECVHLVFASGSQSLLKSVMQALLITCAHTPFSFDVARARREEEGVSYRPTMSKICNLSAECTQNPDALLLETFSDASSVAEQIRDTSITTERLPVQSELSLSSSASSWSS